MSRALTQCSTVEAEYLARELVRGSLGFDAFVRRTEAHWMRLATWLAARWVRPTWMTEDDVRQELVFGAWRAFERFDASRSSNPWRYLTWNAIALTRHAIRRARLGGKRTHSDESRPMRECLCDLPEEIEALAESRKSICGISTEARIDGSRSLLRRSRDAGTMRERMVCHCLASAASIEGAVEELDSDPGVRLALRIDSAEHAERIVRSVVRGLKF